MEVNCSAKAAGRGKTRIHSSEYTYTWVIENYIRFRNDTTNETIASPTIVVYNENDKYQFQLLISTSKVLSCYFGFLAELKVLASPSFEKKVYVRLTVLKHNGEDLQSVDSRFTIKNNATISPLQIDNGILFANCLSDGNLTVKCQFMFRNGLSHIEPTSPDLETATALSKISILDEYETLLESAKFTDVTLVVGEKKFPAHKAILASRSPVFSAMFEHQMLENEKNIVEITDVEPEIMAEVLHFIYASKVKGIKESAADLLAAADKYQLEALRLMCEEVFIDKLNLDNLEEILKIVDKYDMCRRLRDAALKFMSFNGKAVANWENFDRVVKNLSSSLLFEVTKATLLKS